MADAQTLAARVAVLEERIKPLAEFRAWMLAGLAGLILSAMALASAWGALNGKVDRVAEDVHEIRQAIGLQASAD